MDIFSKAIESHLEWRTTLKQHIDNQVFLHDKDVANPHRCVLGRWIDREATAYQSLPSFNEACELHEKFHQYAGEIARHCNANDKIKAESLLQPNGSFHQASMKLIRALMNCDNELAQTQSLEGQARQTLQSLLGKIASRKLLTLDSSSTVREALQTLVEKNIDALAIFQGKELHGTFTAHDYLRKLLQSKESSLDANISDFVEASSLCFYAQDSLDICKQIMRMAKIKRIPVIENESVVGIIREEDFDSY